MSFPLQAFCSNCWHAVAFWCLLIMVSAGSGTTAALCQSSRKKAAQPTEITHLLNRRQDVSLFTGLIRKAGLTERMARSGAVIALSDEAVDEIDEHNIDALTADPDVASLVFDSLRLAEPIPIDELAANKLGTISTIVGQKYVVADTNHLSSGVNLGGASAAVLTGSQGRVRVLVAKTLPISIGAQQLPRQANGKQILPVALGGFSAKADMSSHLLTRDRTTLRDVYAAIKKAFEDLPEAPKMLLSVHRAGNDGLLVVLPPEVIFGNGAVAVQKRWDYALGKGAGEGSGIIISGIGTLLRWIHLPVPSFLENNYRLRVFAFLIHPTPDALLAGSPTLADLRRLPSNQTEAGAWLEKPVRSGEHGHRCIAIVYDFAAQAGNGARTRTLLPLSPVDAAGIGTAEEQLRLASLFSF